MSFDEEVWACLEGGGKAPEKYVKFSVMREMHWTPQQLAECPLEDYMDIVRYLNTEAKYQQTKLRRARG